MVWHHRSAAEIRKDHDALHEQFQRQTVLPLCAALIIIVLVSLGLWWTILSLGWPLTLALLE